MLSRVAWETWDDASWIKLEQAMSKDILLRHIMARSIAHLQEAERVCGREGEKWWVNREVEHKGQRKRGR